jgi:Phytanoyl-CoA dioxygenase (PhyH)
MLMQINPPLSAEGSSDKLSPHLTFNLIHLPSKTSYKMVPSRTSPDPPTASQGLTKEQLATFDRDGYLLIPDALDQQTVSSLLQETHSLLENFSLDDHPMTKFSTGESTEHVGDNYFLTSGDKVRFFFEEGKVILLLHLQISKHH